MLGKSVATFSWWSVIVIILLLNAQVYHFGQSNKQLHIWNWSENATFSGGISMTTVKGSMVYSVGVLYSVGFFVCVICFWFVFLFVFLLCCYVFFFFSCFFVCFFTLPSYSVLCKWLYSFPSEQGIRWEAETFFGTVHKNVGASKPECTRTTSLHRELSRTWLQDSAHVSVILHKVIEWYLHWHGLITARDFSFKDKWDVAGFLFLSKKLVVDRARTWEIFASPFLRRRRDCIFYFPWQC